MKEKTSETVVLEVQEEVDRKVLVVWVWYCCWG
jgi:hypothetical protein